MLPESKEASDLCMFKNLHPLCISSAFIDRWLWLFAASFVHNRFIFRISFQCSLQPQKMQEMVILASLLSLNYLQTGRFYLCDLFQCCCCCCCRRLRRRGSNNSLAANSKTAGPALIAVLLNCFVLPPFRACSPWSARTIRAYCLSSRMRALIRPL